MLRPISERIEAVLTANLAAAATVGLTSALLTIASILSSGISAPTEAGIVIFTAVFFGLLAAIAGGIASFSVYFAGLIVVGVPTWTLLHRLGWTNPRMFVVVGAIESVVAGVFIALLMAPDMVVLAPLLALPGGVAGWALRRWGYL